MSSYGSNQRHLKNTLIPKFFTEYITKGGCLVAASASALTVGAYTIPVYEIYKVGQHIHWGDGLDILGQLGLRLNKQLSGIAPLMEQSGYARFVGSPELWDYQDLAEGFHRVIIDY